jgi:hypothetical protein
LCRVQSVDRHINSLTVAVKGLMRLVCASEHRSFAKSRQRRQVLSSTIQHFAQKSSANASSQSAPLLYIHSPASGSEGAGRRGLMGMGQWRRCSRRRRWVCTSAEPQRDVPAPTASSLLTSGDVAERCRLAAVHPSVVRRPVDGTPIFTTVRRRDRTLRGPTAQRRDGTVVRPSVRPTVLDGYGDDP